MKIDKEASKKFGIKVMRTQKAATEKPKKEKAAKKAVEETVSKFTEEAVSEAEEEKTESLMRDE